MPNTKKNAQSLQRNDAATLSHETAKTNPGTNPREENVSFFFAKKDIPVLKEAIWDSIINHYAVQDAIKGNRDLKILETLYYEIAFNS